MSTQAPATLWQRMWRSPWVPLALAIYFTIQAWPWRHGAWAVVCTVAAVVDWFLFFRAGDKRWGKP